MTNRELAMRARHVELLELLDDFAHAAHVEASAQGGTCVRRESQLSAYM